MACGGSCVVLETTVYVGQNIPKTKWRGTESEY